MRDSSNVILIAEDDDEDFFIARESFRAQCPLADLRRARDGEELLRFLRREAPFEHSPRPAIVLLDLNMPRMDGREALAEMKRDPELRKIPVVALTASEDREDVRFAQRLGVNSFLRKPVGFAEFVDFIKVCYEFGLDLVRFSPKVP